MNKYILLLLTLIFLSFYSLANERRIALVIGNSNYTSMGVLNNAVNDAQDMAQVLRSLGFDVISGVNLNKRQMNEKVSLFDKKLSQGNKEETIGLFYYAGHGLEVEGDNYLVPIDAYMEYQEDAKFEGTPLNRITSRMKYSKNRMNIVILDACRDNPLPKRDRALTNGGWGAISEVASGMFIAYGTSPGRKAADGSSNGRNGLFTKHLLTNIKTKGKTLEQVFKATRVGVLNDSNGKQVTWQNNATTGDFYFASNSTSILSTFPLIATKAQIKQFNDNAQQAFDAKDHGNAFYWFQKAADQNSPYAQTYLGYLYNNGLGVQQDYHKAFEWYKKAADQEHPTGIFNLATFYEGGLGVSKDMNIAIKLYKKAALLGQKNAIKQLETKGISYANLKPLVKATADGIKQFNKKAKSAYDAQNYNEAFKGFLKSAHQGNAYAQYFLGYLYSVGKGTEQNHSTSITWYKKAADQNNRDAQFNLALKYYNGNGTLKNYQQASFWFLQSAKQGYPEAMNFLGYMYDQGLGLDKNYKESYKWFEKAAAENDTNAFFNLGTFYEGGKGFTIDVDKAIQYYKKAARKGHEIAIQKLKEKGITNYD